MLGKFQRFFFAKVVRVLGWVWACRVQSGCLSQVEPRVKFHTFFFVALEVAISTYFFLRKVDLGFLKPGYGSD